MLVYISHVNTAAKARLFTGVFSQLTIFTADGLCHPIQMEFAHSYCYKLLVTPNKLHAQCYVFFCFFFIIRVWLGTSRETGWYLNEDFLAVNYNPTIRVELFEYLRHILFQNFSRCNEEAQLHKHHIQPLLKNL